VRFVSFVNEEAPFFASRTQGSMVYARAAKKRGDKIEHMASLETIGCYFDAPETQSYPPLFDCFIPIPAIASASSRTFARGAP
jgi:hypothetical protein